jgi:hypothetical protein
MLLPMVFNMRTTLGTALILSLVCACTTAPVYHTVGDVSDNCKQVGHRVFDRYADCVNGTLDNQFGFNNDEIASVLEALSQEVGAGRFADAAAIAAFEKHYFTEAEAVDWGMGLRTVLAVGAVVGVVALIAAGASSGVALPNYPSVAGPSDIRRDSIGGCCSSHGGLAVSQVTGQAAQCADGSPSRTCFFDGARFRSSSPIPDRRGCCSWHDGICGSVGDAVVCCDLELSPSCRVR